MKQTAGTLLYRYTGNQLEVLLVHASGNYNRQAPWSIPKGEPDVDEPMETAARRETMEETGIEAQELRALGYADYTKTRKRIHCFTGPAPENAMPHPASWEVDKAQFVTMEQALQLIHPEQAVFLTRLSAEIAAQSG